MTSRADEPNDGAEHNTWRVRPSLSALVVDGTLANALATVSLLAAHHFHVTLADTFDRAKERLAERPPALLITELRLREYNGLQLVLRAYARRPETAALVLSSDADTVLRDEAEAMGATFIVKPIAPRDLAAAAFRTLLRATNRGGAPERIRPPFERRVGDRRSRPLQIETDRRASDRRRDLDSLLALAAGLT